jgi:hypothetical protein
MYCDGDRYRVGTWDRLLGQECNGLNDATGLVRLFKLLGCAGVFFIRFRFGFDRLEAYPTLRLRS